MAKHFPSVPRICNRCKKTFLEIPSRIARGKGTFCSMLCYRGTPKEQFWSKVKKTKTCWIWISTNKVPRGYGMLKRKGRHHYAHRFSYEMHYGTIPKGLQVLHRCDNPSCIRPDHLFLGTQSDNMKDASKKGRCKNQYS